MGTLPTGTVTFLFTDIEVSTKLAQVYPDELPSLLRRHNDVLIRAFKKNRSFLAGRQWLGLPANIFL